MLVLKGFQSAEQFVDWDAKFDRMYQDYEKYAIIPVLMVMFSIAVLGISYLDDGEPMRLGLDFTGGTEATYTIEQEFEPREVEAVFQDAGRADVQVLRQVTDTGTLLSVRVPPPEINETESERILQEAGYDVELQSFSAISAAVSGEFFIQAQMAFALAFTIMSIVIFVAFRDIIPSLAVIFAAGADILFAAAGMVIFGIPLTLGSLAALLMLIGYSVDTDIVLSTRVLKRRRGSVQSRVWSSAKTGMTMSAGGIAGFALLYIVSVQIVGPSELSNIAAVMVIGLLADMPITWFGNAMVLDKYVKGELDGWKVWK